jgi:hypothetical protein
VVNGDEVLHSSCRPCGPRLFDLVERHPLSTYGLTSWSLLERDEELFEIDDVRDEEKSMQALWNRWIFFERRCLFYFSCMTLCADATEKSVPPRSLQSVERIRRDFPMHYYRNRRMEGLTSMAIGMILVIVILIDHNA